MIEEIGPVIAGQVLVRPDTLPTDLLTTLALFCSIAGGVIIVTSVLIHRTSASEMHIIGVVSTLGSLALFTTTAFSSMRWPFYLVAIFLIVVAPIRAFITSIATITQFTD